MPATPHGDHDTASLDGVPQPKEPQPPRTRKEAFTRMKTGHFLSYLDIHATIPPAYIAPTQAIIDLGRQLHDTIILSTGIERREGDPLQERGNTIIAALESLSAGAKELQGQASFMVRAAKGEKETYATQPPLSKAAALNKEYGLRTEFSEYRTTCWTISTALTEKFHAAVKTLLTHKGLFPPETQDAFAQFITSCEPYVNDIRSINDRLSQEFKDHLHACEAEEKAFTQATSASFVDRLFASKGPTAEEAAHLDAVKQVYIGAAPQLQAQADAISSLIMGFRARSTGEGTSLEEKQFLKSHHKTSIATLGKLSKATENFKSSVGDMEQRLSSSLRHLGPQDERLALAALYEMYHGQKEEISKQFTATVQSFGYLRDKAPRSYFEAYSGFIDTLSQKLDGLDETLGDITKALGNIPSASPPIRR